MPLVPNSLLDDLWRNGIDKHDNRTKRLVVASAAGGVPLMREAHKAFGDRLAKPGRVSVISALMELKAMSLVKIVGTSEEGIEVEA